MVSEWSKIIQSTASRNYSCLHLTLHIFVSPVMMTFKLAEKFETRYWLAHLYNTILMSNIENKTLFDISFHQRVSWFRFTVDADMKWDHSEDELLNFHTSIKFRRKISLTNITYLDTISFKWNHVNRMYKCILKTDWHISLSSFCDFSFGFWTCSGSGVFFVFSFVFFILFTPIGYRHRHRSKCIPYSPENLLKWRKYNNVSINTRKYLRK